MQEDSRLLSLAVSAVESAARVTEAVRRAIDQAGTMVKPDRSPVTLADFAAQAIISTRLAAQEPDDPLMGEEDAETLAAPGATALRAELVRHVQAEIAQADERSVLDAIGRAQHGGGSSGRFWVLDPVDGTKGFLRGDQYAIALGLIVDGRVELGVLGCPNLQIDPATPEGQRGCMFVAMRGQGSFMHPTGGSSRTQISVSPVVRPVEASFCESFEAEHSSHGDSACLAQALGIRRAPVRMDSQCKYGTVARGEATFYVRMPKTAEYREKVWDHAAGSLIVEEAGGKVTDIHGNALDFARGRTLDTNRGIVASNGRIHDAILTAIGALGSA